MPLLQNLCDGTYCKCNIFLFIGKRKLLCDKLTVTGDDYASVTGTYIISDEKASKSPDKPVYKTGLSTTTQMGLLVGALQQKNAHHDINVK